MRSFPRYGVLVATLFAAFAADNTASAQDRTETVTTRSRPEVDPLGVHVGSFMLFPGMGVSETYNDNIYLTDTGTVDDFITVFSPGFNLNSNWNRHSLNFGASADIGRYADNSAENYEDYNVHTSGTLDITRRSQLSAGLSYGRLHEERGSPDAANGINPTLYKLGTAQAGFLQRFNRVKVTLTGLAQNYNYEDTVLSGGSVSNQDDRDRNEYEGSVRLGYEIVPQYEAFVKTTLNKRSYISSVDDNGVNRDSSGYVVDGGVRIDLTGKAFGDVFAGYRSQNYDDPTLRNISGADFGADLTWNVTSLTTAKLNITRSTEESTQSGASGYIATGYGISVDHELLRNLLIGGGASYTTNDYKGINRNDDYTRFGLYSRYLMNRYLYLSLGYDHAKRDSNVSGSDYDDNKFMVKVQGQL